MYGPVNGKIATTFLGRQDHGIPTAVLDIDEEHGGSGFGGFDIRVHTTYVQTLLDALHVPTWERLPGTVIRVFIRRGVYVAVGCILEDRWFRCDPERGPRIVRLAEIIAECPA